jgi:hypothetical protein
MAAQDKAELLDVTHREYDKLVSLMAELDAPLALKKDKEDTSIKDVVAHRAHWIELFLGWHADGLAGKAVAFPAPGYKWSELKRYNAELRATQAHMDWPAAQALLHTSARRLMAFIDGHTNQTLYGGPMKGANNDWTPGRWAEAAGPSHFRSAAKYIRSRLKSAGPAR